jgi:hypothetical protein
MVDQPKTQAEIEADMEQWEANEAMWDAWAEGEAAAFEAAEKARQAQRKEPRDGQRT